MFLGNSLYLIRHKAPNFLKQIGLVPWLTDVLTDVFPCWILAYYCHCSIPNIIAISVPGCSEVPGVCPCNLPSSWLSPAPACHHQLPHSLPSYEASRGYSEQHRTQQKLLQNPPPSHLLHSVIFLHMSEVPCFLNSQHQKSFGNPNTYSSILP